MKIQPILFYDFHSTKCIGFSFMDVGDDLQINIFSQFAVIFTFALPTNSNEM